MIIGTGQALVTGVVQDHVIGTVHVTVTIITIITAAVELLQLVLLVWLQVLLLVALCLNQLSHR